MVKAKYTHRYKSAINGRFVKKAYAKKHPKTTFLQKMKVGRKK